MSFTQNTNVDPDFMKYMAEKEAERRRQASIVPSESLSSQQAVQDSVVPSVQTGQPSVVETPKQESVSTPPVSAEPVGPTEGLAPLGGASSEDEPLVPLVSESNGDSTSEHDRESQVDSTAAGQVLSDVSEETVPPAPQVDYKPSVTHSRVGTRPTAGGSVSQPPSPRRLPGAGADDVGQLTSIRVNREGLRIVRSHIPNVRSHADVVAICFRVLFGDEIPLSDNLVAEADRLRETLFGNNTMSKLNETASSQERLLYLERQNQRLIRELQLGIIYLLGDRMNMDVGSSSAPDKVDFLWGQYDLLYRRLKGQAKTFQKDQSEIDGRERYEALNSGKEMEA